MPTVWLRTNRRAVLWGMFLPLIAAIVGAGLLAAAESGAAKAGGAVLLALAAVLLVLLAWQFRQPRIAYEQGKVLFYLRSGGPIRVPVDIVECFLLGQAPAMLSGRDDRSETAAVMVRLSEKAEEWSHLSVKPSLGKWCDGYVTIRGTWCEPLDVQVVNRLNERLADATRESHAARVAP